MKTCPRCGFHQSDQDQRCLRCDAYLDKAGDIDPLAPEGHEQIQWRPGKVESSHWNFLLRLQGVFGRLFYRLRVSLTCPIDESLPDRSPWRAGFLSLIPGLGQLYNHQAKKALLLWGWMAILLAVAILTLYKPFSNLVLLVGLLLWTWSFHDAFITAKRIRRDYLPWQRRVGYYLAWLIYICVFCLVVQFIGRHFLVRFLYISSEQMDPVLRCGERVVVDVWSKLISGPHVGDIVLYDPPRLTLETADGNVAIVNPRSAIERVVAAPGQTFERRQGLFYRNGRLVPPSEQPLIQDQVHWDFKITVPPDRWLVLFTYTGSEWLPGQGTTQAPRLNSSGWVVNGFNEASLIPKSEIQGIVRWVYQPPSGRRVLR